MVTRISTNTFFKIDKPTSAESGDWDVQSTIDIDDFVIYKSIDSIINGKVEWEDTELYQWIVDGLNKGEVKWACNSLKACNQRGQYIINLYDDIKRIGKIFLYDLNKMLIIVIEINKEFYKSSSALLDNSSSASSTATSFIKLFDLFEFSELL